MKQEVIRETGFLSLGNNVGEILNKMKCLCKMLGHFFRSVGRILFVPPPEQEKIEEIRMKAMQYRGIF